MYYVCASAIQQVNQQIINKQQTNINKLSKCENLQVSCTIFYDQFLDMNHKTCNDNML
jgi:hypothetical protein